MPTIYPVQYYERPDNKVYIIAKMPSGRTRIYFVISRLKEFSYDFKENKLIDHKQIKLMRKKNLPEEIILNISLNEPFQKMEEIIVLHNFKPIGHFHTAEQLLHEYIRQELERLPIIHNNIKK